MGQGDLRPQEGLPRTETIGGIGGIGTRRRATTRTAQTMQGLKVR